MTDPSISLEHRVAMATTGLAGAVREIFALSETPEARDLLIRDYGDISGAQLTLAYVASRVRDRIESRITGTGTEW